MADHNSDDSSSSSSSDAINKIADESWFLYQALTENASAIDSLPIRSWNAILNAVSRHGSKATARDRARQAWQYLRTNRVAVRPDKFTAQALVNGLCKEFLDVRETIGVLRECVERGGEVTSYQINLMLKRCLSDATERRREEEANINNSEGKKNKIASALYQDIIDATNMAWDAGRGTHNMHTLMTYLKALKMCGASTETVLDVFEQLCGIKKVSAANGGVIGKEKEEDIIKPDDDILILAMQIKANDDESNMEDKIAYFETLSEKLDAKMPSRAQNALLLACSKTGDYESAEKIWERMNDETNALYKPPDAFATNVVTSIMRKREEMKKSSLENEATADDEGASVGVVGSGGGGGSSGGGGIRNTAMEAFTDHVMRQATRSSTPSQDESDDDQDVAINLTANVLQVLRDEIEDVSLIKRQISSPSKVSEIRERAVADAKSIVDIANAFLDVPKYNDKVTNAVLQVCADARFVKEAKAIVEEYFAMRDDDPLKEVEEATTTTTTTNSNSKYRNNNRQYYNYEQEMVPNVFRSMQYNRFVREEEKIEESDILEYFMETSKMVPVTGKFIESACQACRDRKFPDALLKIYYIGRDEYNHAPRRQIIDIALSALSADGRWQDTIRIMNEDVLEATINTVSDNSKTENEKDEKKSTSSSSFVVDYDDPSKNKVMIPTDKIDEFGVKHLVLSFVNAGEIDQAFSALRLCQFLTDKSCTEAFEIIERAKEKQEKGDGEKKAQMS
jgi:pentatricopeptide repeat protein